MSGILSQYRSPWRARCGTRRPAFGGSLSASEGARSLRLFFRKAVEDTRIAAFRAVESPFNGIASTTSPGHITPTKNGSKKVNAIRYRGGGPGARDHRGGARGKPVPSKQQSIRHKQVGD